MSQSPRLSGRTRFYHDVQLRGPVPTGLVHDPLAEGHPAPALFEAARDWAGREDLAPETPEGEDVLQQFGWLPVLATGGDEGAQAIRQLTEYWLNHYGRYSPAAWRPAVTARRLTRMLHYAGPLVAWADGPLRERIYDSMARQARHLARGLKGSKNHHQLRVILARTLASLCLPEDKQIGGPVSPQLVHALSALAAGDLPRSWRDPAIAIDDVAALTRVEAAFRARRLSGPAELREAIKVGRLYIGGFCTDDRSIVHLPGSQRPDMAALASLAPVCRKEAEALLLPMGYTTMRQGRTLVAMDLGTDADLHGAGALAVTTGQTPLIVNCGLPSSFAIGMVDRMAAWRGALSSPPAASAFDSDALRPASASATETADRPVRHLELATTEGLFARTVALAADGCEIHVEDRLPASSHDYRLHLPRAAYAKIEGDHIALTYRGGKSTILEVSGAEVTIEESVSAWQDGQIDKTLQLVLHAQAATVGWLLKW